MERTVANTKTILHTSRTRSVVTMDELKTHLGFAGDNSSELEDQLATVLDAAVQRISQYMGKSLLNNDVEDYFNGLCTSDTLILSHQASVVSIKYYDDSNTEVEVSTTDYVIDNTGEYTRIKYKGSNLNLSEDMINPVVVEYTNGIENVDDQIKYSVLLYASILFNNKGDEEKDLGDRAMKSIINLLQSHRGIVI